MTGGPAGGGPVTGGPVTSGPVTSGPQDRDGTAGAAARRGRSRYKLGFFALAAAGVIAAAVWALFGSRLLVVRSIEVTGTYLVPKSEVLAAAGIPRGLPLIRVNTGAVARRVERITQVQSARVIRSWPDGVLIAVRERKAALAVPVAGGFDLVDPSGVVVRQVKKRPAGLPRFIPAGPLPGNPGVRAAAGVLRELPPGIARRVTSVTVPTVNAVTLRLARGVVIDWGSPGHAAQKARVLAVLMHTHARFYDVSAPGSAATGSAPPGSAAPGNAATGSAAPSSAASSSAEPSSAEPSSAAPSSAASSSAASSSAASSSAASSSAEPSSAATG